MNRVRRGVRVRLLALCAALPFAASCVAVAADAAGAVAALADASSASVATAGTAPTRAVTAGTPAGSPLRLSPVRRTTIATADPESSLRFYRDLLGFTVEYDLRVTDAGQLAAFAPGAAWGRAIALRRGATLGGSIGLFHAPGMVQAGSCRSPAAGGAVAILLLTDDLAALHRRLKAAGVVFVNEPHAYDQGRGPTDTFTVFDPDCVRVAFAQIRRETLEQSERR